MFARLILPLILCISLLILFGRAEADDYLCSEDGITFAIQGNYLHYDGEVSQGIVKDSWAGYIWANEFLAIVIDHNNDYVMVLLHQDVIGEGTCIEGEKIL